MSVADHEDARALLGGARRVRTRVRGFAPWAPRGTTLELLEQVRGVLGEYEDYLPLTIRQIFYRLVAAHNYEKTCEYLNRARRARIIPMASIRDDGGVISAPDSWDSVEQFMRTIRAMAADFALDRSAGQKTRLVVDCEAAGMVAQLERVAHPLGVTVISSGGFDSTTERHRFAAGLADHDRPTEVLDIGDHDPSGAQQITQYGLETAPPKAGDKRAFRGRTVRTTLSVAEACALPGWAALAAGGICSLVLSREATHVIICADHDASGVGERAARDAAARWLAEGRRVKLALPPRAGIDFNDILRGVASAATEEARRVAD